MTDYANLVQQARQAADMPYGMLAEPSQFEPSPLQTAAEKRALRAQSSTPMDEWLINMMTPQSASDVAAMAALGAPGKVAKTLGTAAVEALRPDEGYAAGIKRVLQGLDFWASPGGGKELPRIPLGQFEETSPYRLAKKASSGGFSVRLPTGDIPTTGFMSGIYGNQDPRVFVFNRKPAIADIKQAAETNIAALQLPERYLGGWFDPQGLKTYIEPSQRFETLRQATKFGERSGQIGVYDVARGETVPVGNWEQFIRDPEFRARVEQMAREGGDYLSQFPQREWWNVYGSPFENVYGTRNVPQIAGFSASTAPNTAPRENMQQMSEYMRRYIRGEPIIQPEWRAPPGLMSLAEGKKLPLETQRVANLAKAAAAQPETAAEDLAKLSRDKVRSEALAMIGDPNAMVFDRHWARLAEKPSAGIYTASEEGVVPSRPLAGKPTAYQQMENVVGPMAREAGRDPRDYSADAWTGIRNTIQKTSQLFGQPFRGSAIEGESKSYADHFVDLVREKAQSMGITVKELEKRLAGGDASLLSVMLGSPSIYAAFRIWQSDQPGSASAGQSATASNGRSPRASSTLSQ
jgi:hypothetical protein